MQFLAQEPEAANEAAAQQQEKEAANRARQAVAQTREAVVNRFCPDPEWTICCYHFACAANLVRTSSRVRRSFTANSLAALS